MFSYQSEVKFTRAGRRNYDKLLRRNPYAQQAVNRMIGILAIDPYNLSRQYNIRKLADEKIGTWRIRVGNYRARYDIEGKIVWIHDAFDRKKGY